MKRYGIVQGKRSRGHGVVILVVLLLVLLLVGCADEPSGSAPVRSAGSGSAALTIHWHDAAELAEAPSQMAAALDCQASGVAIVVVQVYDDSGNWLISSPEWVCSAGGGTITGIPVGDNRRFVVLAEDAEGNIIYQGEIGGITIRANEITRNVSVDAYPFMPTLTAPEDEAEVTLNNLSLEWGEVKNADQYWVLVATDDTFAEDRLEIDDTTQETTYAPTGLAPSTRYYWRVHALDAQRNPSAALEHRWFVTSDCTYAIEPVSRSFDSEGGPGSFAVTSESYCEWDATIDISWIEITAGASGNGDGTVSYTVAANSGVARSAAISVAGQTHQVFQDAAGCSFTIDPTNRTVSAIGESYTVNINATHDNCDWTASENVEWITISPINGTGDGTVRVTVMANSGPARSAEITINGRTHTINQEAALCTFTIDPRNRLNLPSGGTTYTITVDALRENCPWTASESVGWLSITPSRDMGDGTVRVTVDPNTTANTRETTITVAGIGHRVTQEPSDITGTWRVRVRCENQNNDVISILVDINETSGGNFSGEGDGTDYDGTPLHMEISGTYNSSTRRLTAEMRTSFTGSACDRIDSFTTTLSSGDTGFISTTAVESCGGCDALVRMTRQ